MMGGCGRARPHPRCSGDRGIDSRAGTAEGVVVAPRPAREPPSTANGGETGAFSVEGYDVTVADRFAKRTGAGRRR